jgi:hypothetical protein
LSFFYTYGIDNLMMQACPFCGHHLQEALTDGLTNCAHCDRVFDSSEFNQLLAAAWQLRRQHWTLPQLEWHLKLDPALAILVYTFVHDHSYSHDEFSKLLKRLGVANKSYINYDEQ